MWVKAENGTLVNLAAVSCIQIKGVRAENDFRGAFVKFRIVTKVDDNEIVLMDYPSEEEAQRQLGYLGEAMEVVNWP